MNTKVIFLILGLVLHARGKPAELSITCDAPSARIDDAANVVCHFHTDVTNIPFVHVAVDHYATGSNDPDEVASCTNVYAGGFKCESKLSGYSFRMTKDSDKMVLKIANVTDNDAGRFVCKLMAPDIDHTRSEPCQLNVSESTKVQEVSGTTESEIPSTKPTSASGVNVGVIIGPVAVVILLVVAVVSRCYYLRRRRCTISANNFCCFEKIEIFCRRSDRQVTEKKGASAELSSPPTPASLHKNQMTEETKEETNPLLNAEENMEVIPDKDEKQDTTEQKCSRKSSEDLSNTSGKDEATNLDHPAAADELSATSDTQGAKESARFTRPEVYSGGADNTGVNASEVSITTYYTSDGGYEDSDTQTAVLSDARSSYEDQNEEENANTDLEKTPSECPTKSKNPVLDRMIKSGIARPAVGE